jgi:hypothetical protein
VLEGDGMRAILIGLLMFAAAALRAAPAAGVPSDETTATPAPKAPRPCSAPEYRQFDFWLGEWDVTENGKPAGSSKISEILGGCVILEEWQSAGSPYAGKSFNRYDSQTGKWEQVWVDTNGRELKLAGEYKDGKMVLEGESVRNGATILNRVTWYNNSDGTVRQHWVMSKDGGKTWTDAFDGLYVKKK